MKSEKMETQIAVIGSGGAGLAAVLGPSFRLESEERETHLTPWGAQQRFVYVVLERVAQVCG